VLVGKIIKIKSYLRLESSKKKYSCSGCAEIDKKLNEILSIIVQIKDIQHKNENHPILVLLFFFF
jgi:hypothetical protein